MGRLAQAENVMRTSISYWPKEPRQHVLLGEILEQEGHPDAARQEFLTELDLGESGEARTELAKLTH
jgi:Flp pilus assembly protein TadD